MSQNQTKIHGYVAASAYDDNPPAEEQERQIEVRANEIEGDFVGCHTEADLSPEDSFRKRPGFQDVLSELRPGDLRLAVTVTSRYRARCRWSAETISLPWQSA